MNYPNTPRYSYPTPPPRPIKSISKQCTYYDICPSASDWCENRQVSSECLPFLDNAEAKLNAKISTLYGIKRYIEVNEE